MISEDADTFNSVSEQKIQLYPSLIGTSGEQIAPTSPAPNFPDSSPCPVPQSSQPYQ